MISSKNIREAEVVHDEVAISIFDNIINGKLA